MKNKLFLLGIGIMVALSFVFIACEDPIYRLEPSTLPGPGNLTANIEHEGIVILKWDNVTSASSYKVVRRDTEKKVEVVLSASVATNYYVDVVSHTNELVNGIEYEYAVISNSGNAHLQNGRSTVKAKPSIPARADFAPAAADINITVERFVNANGTDQLLVKVANKPNLKYEVAYTYGSGTIVREFEVAGLNSASASQATWYLPYNTAIFPTFGGNNTITVRASFRGDNSYYDGTASATATANFTLAGLTAPNVSANNNDIDGVWISWGPVVDATGYRVYKAEVSGSVNSPNINTNSSAITVLSDWTQVNSATNPILDPEQYSGTGYGIYDSVTDRTKQWLYAVIADGAAGAKSAPGYAMSYTSNPSNLISNPNLNVGVTGDKIELTWTADPTVTYTLHYAEAKHNTSANQEPTLNNFELTGSWTAILFTDENVEQGRGEVTQTGVTKGKAYIWRITSVKNGVTRTDFAVINNSQNTPFHSLVYFTLSQVSQDNQNTNAGDLTLLVKNTVGYDDRNLSFSLYRAVSTNGSQTPYTKVTDITYTAGSSTDSTAALPNTNGDGVSYTDTGLDPALTYMYKIVLPSGNNFVNNATTEISNAQPNGRTANITANIVANRSGSVVNLGTVPSPANLPTQGIRIATGTYITYTDTTMAPTNNGPSIEGLSLTIRYNTIAVTPAVSVQKEFTATVKKLSSTIAINAGQPNEGSQTTYHYYIDEVPTDAQLTVNSQLGVRFPWQNTGFQTTWTVQTYHAPVP